MIDFNHDDDSVTNTGQAIAAINIAAFGDVADFKASVDALVRDFSNSSGCPASNGFSFPASAAMPRGTARTRDGIPIAAALMRGLDQVADELGMAKLA